MKTTTGSAINFNTALSGYPMAVQAAYGKGTFYVLAMPDDFADLYRLPQSVLTQIRSLLGRDCSSASTRRTTSACSPTTTARSSFRTSSRNR